MQAFLGKFLTIKISTRNPGGITLSARASWREGNEPKRALAHYIYIFVNLKFCEFLFLVLSKFIACGRQFHFPLLDYHNFSLLHEYSNLKERKSIHNNTHLSVSQFKNYNAVDITRNIEQVNVELKIHFFTCWIIPLNQSYVLDKRWYAAKLKTSSVR